MKPVDPRLLRAAHGSRRSLVATAALGVVASILVIAQASLISTATARAIDEPGAGLAALLAGLAAVFAGRAIVAWAMEVTAGRASTTAKQRLRGRLLARASRDAADATPASRAEVATLATSGLDALDGYFARYLPQLVLAVVAPALVLVVLWSTDLTAALTVTLTLPLIPVFMVLIGRATEAANARRWTALARLSHHFLDVVEGMPTLRAFGRGRAQPALVRENTDRYRATTMATLRIAFLSSLALELLATLSVALVAVGVGLRMVDGGLDLRTGLFVILLAPEAYLPLRQVGVHYHASAAGVAAADAAFAVIERPAATPGAETFVAVPDGPAGAPTLRVDALTVWHGDDGPAAPASLSFVATPGRVVCLAGRSGSGKSTALAVLLGLRAPSSGAVTVEWPNTGPVALAELPRAWWHARIGWADQHPYLIAGTIADNVTLATSDVDEQLVDEVLGRAGLALATDRRLGPTAGSEVSAGERRRLGVARALYRRAPIVLLDEPTAGLDAATEAHVLSAVRAEADRGATVVMVAHRPAALAMADEVVKLG